MPRRFGGVAYNLKRLSISVLCNNPMSRNICTSSKTVSCENPQILKSIGFSKQYCHFSTNLKDKECVNDHAYGVSYGLENCENKDIYSLPLSELHAYMVQFKKSGTNLPFNEQVATAKELMSLVFDAQRLFTAETVTLVAECVSLVSVLCTVNLRLHLFLNHLYCLSGHAQFKDEGYRQHSRRCSTFPPSHKRHAQRRVRSPAIETSLCSTRKSRKLSYQDFDY